MTTEPKLLTEQQVRDLHGLPQDALVAFFQAHGLIAEEPVDECEQIVLGVLRAAGVVMDKRNASDAVAIDDAADWLRARGMELAPRKELTREMVRELIIDARPKYLLPGDFEGRYGKNNKEAAEAFVTRLHAAILERLK